MWLSKSKSHAGRKRRKHRVKPRPFFLRVNTSSKERGVFASRAARSLAILCGAVGIVLLIGTGARETVRSLLTRNELFRIRELDIRCYGDVIEPERVIEYAGLNAYSNLFEIDIRGVREHLIAAVPRIEAVEISRFLNGVLAVEVMERIPVARICMESYHLTVDAAGYVLGPSTGLRLLPVISGHYGHGVRPGMFLGGTRVMNALEVLEVCENTPIGQAVRIESIDLADRDALTLRLDDGAAVLLAWRGMSEHSAESRGHLERKLVKLVENIRQAASSGERLVEIDMTMERNFPARTVRIK